MTGREIRIDRHLLAGHRVQREPRRDFRDPARTLGDDHEVHNDQDDEHHHADNEIASHHEAAKDLDDVAGRLRAFMAMGEDEAGGRNVERQPQQCRQQQHGWKGRKFKRLFDQQRRHQDEDGQRDRNRQKEVEQEWRDRDDEHHHQRHHAEPERIFATCEKLGERVQVKRFVVEGRSLSHIDQPAARTSPGAATSMPAS